MFGRLDVIRDGICPDCCGKKVNRRNRKQKCPTCLGDGKKSICQTCGYDMPCPGTNNNIFDQTYCNLAEKKK